MPVISALAAIGIGAAGAAAKTLASKAVAGGGGKKAAAANANAAVNEDAGKWGDRFNGIMSATSKSVNTDAVDQVNKTGSGNGLGVLNRENLGSLADKYPDNPAYQLALKADDIFKPEIVGVPS